MNLRRSLWFSFLHPAFTIMFLILIHAPNGSSELEDQYQECGNTFSCGGITGIGYPFRGPHVPPYCGHPNFELSCDDRTNVTTLDIKDIKYRVLEIDHNNDTMTIAREDIMEEKCPRDHVNTTLDHMTFEYDLSCKNFTFFYGCSASEPPPGLSYVPCGGDQKTYVASGAYGPGMFCKTSVIVPGTGYEAHGGSVDYVLLDEALQKGFEIKWQIDNKFCDDCRASKGRCGNDLETYQTVCYCPHPPFITNVCKHSNDASQTPDNKPSSEGTDQKKKPSSEGPSNPASIITGTLLSIAGTIIFSVVIIFYIKRRCSPKPPANNQDIENILLQHGHLAPRRYKYSKIKKITKSFSDKLGKGGYGSVYKGMLPDGSLVAVKVLKETDSNGEEFINEVASISRTSHVNIVTLLGFCYEGSKRALVYEFMPNKSLDMFLSNNGSSADTDCSLNFKKLYNIAVGIAKGLEYLHTGCNTRIVHFDIKPQNVLLDEDLCPKISDFGLAKLCKKKQSILSVMGTRGTIGYIAPEMFCRNFGGVSHKSDVYSYGMMVLEMAGAKKIDEADATQSSENYFPDKIYKHVVVDEFMSEDVEEIVKKMFLVGFWCIQTTPSDRPSMSKVVEMLEGSVQSIQIPPKPTMFSPAFPDHNISLPLSAYVETTNSDEGWI